MRKMFSASGSARKAARKSAAVRRKKHEVKACRDGAQMHGETDYLARALFLYATEVMTKAKPAPIDKLLELMPAFSSWLAPFPLEENPMAAAVARAFAPLQCKGGISQLGESSEA